MLTLWKASDSPVSIQRFAGVVRGIFQADQLHTYVTVLRHGITLVSTCNQCHESQTMDNESKTGPVHDKMAGRLIGNACYVSARLRAVSPHSMLRIQCLDPPEGNATDLGKQQVTSVGKLHSSKHLNSLNLLDRQDAVESAYSSLSALF